MQTKVMIVEDDFIIRMFIEKVVLDCGCEIVLKSSSYQEAVTSTKGQVLDLILMDIGLYGTRDGRDGIDAVEEIKKHLPNVHVIYLTGNSDQATLIRAQRTNPDGYIFKPINEELLERELKKILTKINE